MESRAIADSLGSQGYTVIGTATSESGAERITQRFQEKGLLVSVCDLM